MKKSLIKIRQLVDQRTEQKRNVFEEKKQMLISKLIDPIQYRISSSGRKEKWTFHSNATASIPNGIIK